MLSQIKNGQVEYHIEISPQHPLGSIQKSTNPDNTLSFTMSNDGFAFFLNSKDIYKFEEAFPGLTTPKLQRVYTISLDENVNINPFLNRQEVVDMIQLEEPQLTGHYPNDYIETLYENLPNTAMDLIKAPLAWTITKGDPNVLIGIADTKVDQNHEDLQGKIALSLGGNNTAKHGTGVASMAAGNTNNNLGIASIGYNSRLVVTNSPTYSLAFEVAQIPGVKVVNMSWLYCSYNENFDLAFQELTATGVLFVAAAGNGTLGNSCGSDGNGYAYPASYDSVLSVTSVGSRYPIGFHNTNGFWVQSWKDVHEARPHTSETSSHTHNDKVDVCAPGQYIIGATDNYDDHPSGYSLGVGTSRSAPIVSGLAALIFAVNPNLTAYQVKDIIKNTADDIYYISYNQPYIGQLGTGRINAYRAVLTAECMANPTPGLDLAMQNSDLDDFNEPDTATQQPWNSEDIWVRNQDDGLLVDMHQNPEYDPVNSNYVYVRVTNNSCEVSSGNDQLKLYWAKANTSLSWPDHWDGGLSLIDPVTLQSVIMGGEVGILNIPSLEIGETATLEFEWSVPNPDDYENINNNPWHFCLLSRIVSADDPMTFLEGDFITDNVTNNNNIAWKNLTVIDIDPNITAQVGAVVGVSNSFDQAKSYTLELVKDNNEPGKAIYDEAEVAITMDNIVYDAWDDGGKQSQHFQSSFQANKVIVDDNNATIEGIQLDANETGTVYVSFNFLTEELTNKKKYVYHLIQRDATTNKIIGGETFEIRKQDRESFSADAGDDKEIDRDETITITAAKINEAATYKWYDPEGNLVYTGTELTVSPQVSKQYKLEIISDADGYKDYDEVEVTVNPYSLESLAPNPATSQVTATYDAQGATSAYLMVVSTHDGTSNNYIVDPIETSINLDISSYPTGIYTIALVCDGDIQDSKNFLKQ